MIRFFLNTRSFSARLVLGVVVLVFTTTLSAGVPAFWLTRTQLERQAWSQVENTRQATLSLLQAEGDRLLELASLFAERPTLQQLVQEENWVALTPYLRAFQEQSESDILLFCDAEGLVHADQPVLDHCPAPGTVAFALVQAQPTLLATSAVDDDRTKQAIGIAVTGRWLNEQFLQQLAADTGVQQSILALDGVRLTTSMLGNILGAQDNNSASMPEQAGRSQGAVTLNGQPFFTASSFLNGATAEPVFLVEVALPVNDLIATENWALAILIASTALVTILGVSLATWYIRRMTRPLWQLTHIAREIAQGDFVVPIPTFSGPLEVATLALALQRSHASMRQALSELAHARDWLNNLIQSIVEGVIIFDSKGRITFFSQGAETLTGRNSQDAHGHSINDLFRLAEAEAESFLDVVPLPGQRRQIDVITPSNKPLTLAITLARLTSLNGDKPQSALVLRDVTEEEAARHLRSYFLASITHEFRTPLSTLKASLELLLDEHEALSASEMRQLLKPTYLSLLSLQTLIDNLLESSRIEAGRFTIRRTKVDLHALINDAVHIVKPLIERRRQRLQMEIGADLPQINADAPHLTQVLVNLLSNAAKYSPTGEEIDLHVTPNGHKLRVAVADRGPGIPEAERLNLFRRFVRLDSQGGEQYGIGLGLYVVKTTIEAHDGQIGVDDRPGGGSIFWFELPIQGL